jgi:hypothetical protein
MSKCRLLENPGTEEKTCPHKRLRKRLFRAECQGSRPERREQGVVSRNSDEKGLVKLWNEKIIPTNNERWSWTKCLI